MKPKVSIEEFQRFISKNYVGFLEKLAGLRSASMKIVHEGFR
mgnify:CR=1 FL=1